MNRKSYLYEHYSWPELSEVAKHQPVVVLPIGSVEDHGPHLPLDTDNFLIWSICEAAAQNKTAIVENEKEAWRAERDSATRESKALAERLQSMEAAYNVKQSNVAAALEQVEFLNSEVVSASAERFKLVAAAQGEKRRHRTALNQQTSALEDKIKRAEALTATQATQIKHLEEIRTKLDKRVEVLETLLKSEREVAERKITRLSEQLSAERPADSVVGER